MDPLPPFPEARAFEELAATCGKARVRCCRRLVRNITAPGWVSSVSLPIIYPQQVSIDRMGIMKLGLKKLLSTTEPRLIPSVHSWKITDQTCH